MTETAHTPLPELRPCPFCGSGVALGPGRYTQASFSGVEMQTLGESDHHVWCGTCGAQGSTEATEAEALTAWNTRAGSHHRLVEALSGLLDEIGKSGCADAILDSAAAGSAFAIIAETEGRRG